MPAHPEAPAAERAPRVPVAASSERGSGLSRHSAATAESRSASAHRGLPDFARLPRFQSAAGHRPALRHIGGRHSECPNGASSFSPGLARQRRDYPGLNEQNSHNPEGVASLRPHRDAATTPSGLLNHFVPLSQGSSRLATLGWRTESRWDSQTARACPTIRMDLPSLVNARTITLFWNHHSDVSRAVCSASSRAFPRLLSGVRGGVRARHFGTACWRNTAEATAVGRSLGGTARRGTQARLGTAASRSSSATDCSTPIRFS